MPSIVYESVLERRLTVGVWVDLCKGPQGETDTVLRACEAHISKERRHHQVLICGVRAEEEESWSECVDFDKCQYLQEKVPPSFQHVALHSHNWHSFILTLRTLCVSISITWANRWPHPQCGGVYNKHLWGAIWVPQWAGPPCWCRWWWPYAPEPHVWSGALCSASPGQRHTKVWVMWKVEGYYLHRECTSGERTRRTK